MEMKKRSIAGCIVLTFVTLGIYGIYWFVKLTLGIYGLYWAYKLGQKVDRISGNSGNSGIIYLLLSLLGLGIIAKALAQNELNGRIERQENVFEAAA